MRPEQRVEHMVRARPGVHRAFMATRHTPSITRVEAELGERHRCHSRVGRKGVEDTAATAFCSGVDYSRHIRAATVAIGKGTGAASDVGCRKQHESKEAKRSRLRAVTAAAIGNGMAIQRGEMMGGGP
ncbi:hypothetical protein B296_00008570 [Ensete ventricosum]|uniref:Uncharacterized protein n=1 Tax=Ensete ventricosum TaxID=4639 RepID=A0A427ASB0_ENSVE|nr:hypothetical protein B296_00008570 [Ensete ventricosum]